MILLVQLRKPVIIKMNINIKADTATCLECGKDYIEDIFKHINLQENDVVLYLGGRIDDDNLYPPGYIKYLRAKIKRLKPTKIICHTHLYAKKYYERGVLSESTKIDMILTHASCFGRGVLEVINPEHYKDHRTYIKTLINKNPNMIYAIYICHGHGIPILDKNGRLSISIESEQLRCFEDDYDLTNIKYFGFSRDYFPDDLVEGTGKGRVHATDGFAIITHLVKAGFKNLNIVGFTAFGSKEDQSHFTEYGAEDSNLTGRKYFDIITSENQRAEADILQSWVQTKKINNLEDYGELMHYLK